MHFDRQITLQKWSEHTTIGQYFLRLFDRLLLSPASMVLANTSDVCKRRLLNERVGAALDERSNSAKVTSSYVQVLRSLVFSRRRRSTTVPDLPGPSVELSLVR